MSHRSKSFWKSGLRIVGYGAMLRLHFAVAAVWLILAEVVGIFEEIDIEFKVK